jgi:ketosteroid isomerase-like protein
MRWGEEKAMQQDPVEIARASYRAYVDKDRSAIETLIANDFHFTSPLDNRIDRATYFARCWPNSAMIAGFEFIHVVAHGDRIFVTYEGRNVGGARFRNTEILTIRDGKLLEAEVYFGWSIPHEAPEGGFTMPNGSRPSGP